MLLVHQLYTTQSSWHFLVTPLTEAGFNVLTIESRHALEADALELHGRDVRSLDSRQWRNVRGREVAVRGWAAGAAGRGAARSGRRPRAIRSRPRRRTATLLDLGADQNTAPSALAAPELPRGEAVLST